MIFHILTLFPEIFQGYLESSILGKAITRGLIELNLVNIRDYATDRHHSCDDYTYGGGAGLVLKPEPLAGALDSVGCFWSAGQKVSTSNQTENKRVIYLTPSGRLFNQEYAEKLAALSFREIILICGRYEGIDQRIIDTYVTDEISVGDYILSGGETAAMVLIDAVARLIEGVITEDSLEEESFRKGLLEYPQYTRPYEFRGSMVPEILLSGHHAKIACWRLEKSIEKTLINRPELLKKKNLHPDILKVLEKIRKGEKQDGQD